MLVECASPKTFPTLGAPSHEKEVDHPFSITCLSLCGFCVRQAVLYLLLRYAGHLSAFSDVERLLLGRGATSDGFRTLDRDSIRLFQLLGSLLGLPYFILSLHPSCGILSDAAAFKVWIRLVFGFSRWPTYHVLHVIA